MDAAGIDPAERARYRGATGRPVQAAGRTWLLAVPSLADELDAERDELYDAAVISGRVERLSVFALGLLMIQQNYRLANAEAAAVLLAVDREELVDAVVSNMLVDELPPWRRGYSHWARTGLIANGIDPAKMPGGMVAGVINHLVRTGRMAPLEGWTEAGRYAGAKGELVDLMTG